MKEIAYKNTDWQAEAECRSDVDPELFFPDRSTRIATEMAREVCNRCVVKDKCLEYALDNNEPFGIWGGLNEEERRSLLRRRRRVR